ncbi:hypothetical protein ACFDR9_002630 [Janthinobacterium sp. CG_23.3]|uniref:Ig-like domain-containing protein n=1 Tax=Janthinobacterium sp. CG_23.3 TaxID=3349634 RepID=UPI0038D399CC
MNIPRNSSKPFSAWLALAACAALLAACGGGGGNPGAVPGTTPPGAASKVASVVLVGSAESILASGETGTEVVLTAIVKDANNTALKDETVAFSADSGTVSSDNLVSDATGAVTAKLSTKGNTAERNITVTASVGGVKSTALVVKVVKATTTSIASIQLTANSVTLASAGTAEVSIVALVKDAANSVVPNALVNFAADSGALSQPVATTNALGQASVKLGTSADPTLRAITVTATVGGKSMSTVVNVVGTKLSIAANNTLNLGASAELTVKLVDSAGAALANKAVTFSAASNPVTVKGGGAAVTDASGQLVLVYQVNVNPAGSADTVTVKSTGDTASTTMTINASNFNVKVVNAGGATQSQALINTCQRVAIHNDTAGVAQTGNVGLGTSRGNVYSDSACTLELAAPLTFSAGDATGYVKATSPGLASLTATAAGVSVQGTVEFVAPLVASANVTGQADPALVGPNLPGSSTQQSTVRAIVRDGTAANNLVKNAWISFSIQKDGSGGALSSPSRVQTGSDGAASVNFIPGASTTAVNGVVVRAKIDDPAVPAAVALADIQLTVAKSALFISAGTGNSVGTPSSTTYSKEYVVFVTDGGGGPAANVDITVSVRPRNYYKGIMLFPGLEGPWTAQVSASCANEDVNSNGILDAGEDFNTNGFLDPGIPVQVTSSAKTDANGMAVVTFTYARDRAFWLDIDFTVRGKVSGTESTYVGYTLLRGLNSDYAIKTISPPGVVSPYGRASACNDKN